MLKLKKTNYQVLVRTYMEKLIFSYTADKNIKWYKPLWKTVCQPLKNLNIYLLYDPAIPLLGIYPRKESICPYKNLCTNTHTAAPFVAAKTGNNQMSISRKVNFFKNGIAIQWNTILLLSKKK